jgi:hypothetical protein
LLQYKKEQIRRSNNTRDNYEHNQHPTGTSTGLIIRTTSTRYNTQN